MKKWLDRYDGGGQTPARDNTIVYRNVLPIAGPKLPAPSYISATSDYKDSEWYKQESEDYKRRRNITQPILHAADVTTDIMQLGRFIPLPQAQAIGTLGSELGLLIDSYQAADAYANNDYVNSGINAASTLIPLYMSRTKFLRDMHNTKPGSLADKIASYGNRSGTYLPLSGIRPNLIKNPVMRKAVNQNKKTLLGLAAETAYDSYAEGGESINAGWLDKYADGGQKNNKLSAEEIKNISAYTDFLNGDSPFLNRSYDSNTSRYIPSNNNPINIVNTPGALLNRKGDQNVFNRAASFLEFQNRMNEAKPVSLNPRVSKQNDIIRSLPTNGKNYAIVDKKADSIFYFNPQGENITGEPVITGASRNDLDKGLSMAQWMKETGDTDHEHYFEYLKQNNLQTTPSGIFHLNRLRTDVAQDPNRAWRFINSAFRPDRARTVYENRIKDYGPRQLMYTFSDENNKPSSKAIHGTAREQRLDAFNNPNSDRALSNGCINVNGKSICFNALVPGSNLYILPEKSNDYLYPQKKMDVNKLSPLNDYYEDGGSIHNWRDVKVPHKKNQLSGWLDEL